MRAHVNARVGAVLASLCSVQAVPGDAVRGRRYAVARISAEIAATLWSGGPMKTSSHEVDAIRSLPTATLDGRPCSSIRVCLWHSSVNSYYEHPTGAACRPANASGRRPCIAHQCLRHDAQVRLRDVQPSVIRDPRRDDHCIKRSGVSVVSVADVLRRTSETTRRTHSGGGLEDLPCSSS
jgi:hypothetical protein